MDFSNDIKRMNVEGADDRLSNLPDDLIHKILSFVDIKQAIEISELSSRWRNIWTSMPSLNFSSEKFHRMPKFSAFVTDVLYHRNNRIDVFSVKLSYCANSGEEIVRQAIVKRILNYALSHNVQQLNITCLYGKMKYPLSVFSSRSLKHLTLDGYSYKHDLVTSPTWELPALEILNLYNATLYDNCSDKCAGLFSNCANLKNLTFKECTLDGSNGFNIHHPKLSNLTLDNSCVGATLYNGCGGVNVDTPQLKNLTIIKWRKIHLISAPNLSSLTYKDYGYDYDEDDVYKERQDIFDNPCGCGIYDCDCSYNDDNNHVDPLQLSTQLYHLEKVDICIDHPYEDKEYMQKLFNLLQQLKSVKFLTLNLEFVTLLSSWLELVSDQSSPFVSLEALKIYPLNVDMEEEDNKQPKVTFSDEVKNYLLDSSPCATLTIVSYEEIIAMNYVTLARNLIGKLQVLLQEWKKNTETYAATVNEQVEVGNHMDTELDWHFGERVMDIRSYWADLNTQLEEGRRFTDSAISMLQGIETALAKMPMSYQAKLHATYSSLSEQADTMMDNMMDRMKMQGDTKPNRPDVYFYESDTSSDESS